MSAVATKTFVRSSKLKDLGDGAQVAPLVIGQTFGGRDIDDVKGIGGHYGGVYEPVIDEVPNHL